MRDPSLAPSLFVRDRVLSRETVLHTHDFSGLHGAVQHDEGLLFSGSQRLNLSVTLPTQDLSRFDQLALTMKNCVQHTLLVGVRLIRRTPDGLHGQSVSFTGGRTELAPGQWDTLLFPRESFGTYGQSTDWTDLLTFELSCGYDRTHQGPAEIKVMVGSLEAESRDRLSGPRLTHEGLAHVLGTGNLPEPFFQVAARHATYRFLQGREDMNVLCDSGLTVPPPHPYPRESADTTLTGKIMGQQVGTPIPWNANPLGIQEWTHFLNRHHFMRTLAIAVGESREVRYAEALDRYVASWIADNPVPVGSNGGAGPTWETLTAAWRLREWMWVRRCAWASDAFGLDTRELMMRSVWEHALHLLDHRGHPNNWIMVESCALALAGMWFPEFRDAALWMRTGVERLRIEFQRQFFPDGTHFEISPLYHAICAHAMLEVRQSARIRALTLPDEFGKPLERTFTYLAALCRPNFTWPSLNDSGSSESDYSALLSLAGTAFDRPDLLWHGTRGQRGSTPQRTFHVFPDAGIGAMRSGYVPDANWLVFRAGPSGAAHVHDDVLGLDVSALGVPRLVDPGITTYAPDTLSDYYRSAEAHNTLLVDGHGPNRAALPFRERIAPARGSFSWKSGDNFEALFGMCRDLGEELPDVVVHRSVLFVRSAYWIVRDTVLGDGDRELVTCWQFSPARIHPDPKTASTRVVDATGPQFEIIPVPGFSVWNMDVHVGSSSPVAGWTSVGGRDEPSFSIRYRTLARLPFVQEWLLLPFRGRPHSGVHVTRSEEPDGSTLLKIAFPDCSADLVRVGNLVSGAIESPEVPIRIDHTCVRM